MYSGTDLLIVLVCFVFALFSALILHEVAHGFVALKCGDPTAKFAGRLSLNPAKHLDPFGTIALLICGIGWAKPVPVNPYNFRNYKKASFLVSIAGITTNLILGFISSLLYFVFVNFVSGFAGEFFSTLFLYMMAINVMLAVFNFLPIPPLDGFNMIATFAKPNNRFVEFMRNNQLLMLIVLLVVADATGLLMLLRNTIISAFCGFWELIFAGSNALLPK